MEHQAGPLRGIPDLRSHNLPINNTILENQIQRQVEDPPNPLSLRANSRRDGVTLFKPSQLALHEKLHAYGRKQLNLPERALPSSRTTMRVVDVPN